jgi:hypothetical protein
VVHTIVDTTLEDRLCNNVNDEGEASWLGKHKLITQPNSDTRSDPQGRMTQSEEPTDGLILAMRERGHDPAMTAMNGRTGYIEATCTHCNKRAWGWYFARSGSARIDVDGPGVEAPCAHVK